MKTIFSLLFIILMFMGCHQIEDTVVYFQGTKQQTANVYNDDLIKRQIFFSDILKNENLTSASDFNKNKIVYHGKMYFIRAPKYLPLIIRQNYRNMAYELYQSVLSNDTYIANMKDVSFHAFEIDDNFVDKINKMERGDISFIQLNSGYAIFLFEDVQFLNYNDNRERVELLRFNYKEEKYMDALYYSPDTTRNYGRLIDIEDNNTNRVIASYRGNNIYIADLYNDFLDSKVRSRILNETDETARITIFEENVFRPFIEKIYFSSMDMKTHPMYNIYLQGYQKIQYTNSMN